MSVQNVTARIKTVRIAVVGNKSINSEMRAAVTARKSATNTAKSIEADQEIRPYAYAPYDAQLPSATAPAPRAPHMNHRRLRVIVVCLLRIGFWWPPAHPLEPGYPCYVSVLGDYPRWHRTGDLLKPTLAQKPRSKSNTFHLLP